MAFHAFPKNGLFHFKENYSADRMEVTPEISYEVNSAQKQVLRNMIHALSNILFEVQSKDDEKLREQREAIATSRATLEDLYFKL